MAEHPGRVLRPRRRGPPQDHTYSNFMPSTGSYQLGVQGLPSDASSVVLDPTTVTGGSDGKKLKDTPVLSIGSVQNLAEIIAWLKDDSTMLLSSTTSLGFGKFVSGGRTSEQPSAGYPDVQSDFGAVLCNSQSTHNTLMDVAPTLETAPSIEVSWEVSMRQRECVIKKLTSTLYAHQLSMIGVSGNTRPMSDLLNMSLRSQQLEKQVFQSSKSQDEYFHRLALEIRGHRQPLAARESVTQSEKRKKYGTNLLRSLLQGETVSLSYPPDASRTITSASCSEEVAPPSRRRRRKRRRNEYDFGKRRKYPRQEKRERAERRGVCQISSHQLPAHTVSSGTVLEECADICDLSHHTLTAKPQLTPLSSINTRTQTPRECCPFCVKYKQESKERSLRRRTHQWKQGERYSTRLWIKHFKFPFLDLPLECKMHVFSFLDAKSKAVAAQVCVHWKELLYDADAWSNINLDFLDHSPAISNSRKAKSRDNAAKIAYESYQTRVKKFIDFQSELIHPRVTFLSFHFDIGNFMDNWYAHLKKFFQHAELKKLQRFECNWQVTKAKPASLERYCCFLNKTRVLFKLHHYRSHIFHKMLKQLSQESRHVRVLKMPFDWSERAVLFLCRWRELEEVRLYQYLTLQPLSQLCLDTVLGALQYLTVLQMDVCIPVYSHHLLYSFSHSRLMHLNLSNCQGFFLKRLCLPELKTIELSRKPWQGQLLDGEVCLVPCVYSLLCNGAPKLEWINRHKLHGYWQQFSYHELEVELSLTCPCNSHWVRSSTN